MTTNDSTPSIRERRSASRFSRTLLRLGAGVGGVVLALTLLTGQASADTGTTQRRPHPQHHNHGNPAPGRPAHPRRH